MKDDDKMQISYHEITSRDEQAFCGSLFFKINNKMNFFKFKL